MDRATALFVLTLVLVGAWLLANRLRRKRGPRRSGEATLLRICRGDAEQAERLIRGETSRSPGISRAEAASLAVERYGRDNG